MMSNLVEFNRDAAKRYLQNIVFVDDEIYSRVSGKPVVSTDDIPAFRSPFANSSLDPAPIVNNDAEAKVPYHPQHLVQSFAKLGMVCALYEPQQNFSADKGSEIFNLCERADVVILDWDLYGHNGENIMPLIANLVDESQNSVPHHSRLCAIYTTKPELDRVANSVFDFLQSKKLNVDEVYKPATLIAGSTRIIVLGKPGVTNRPPEIKVLEVKEEDLAERVIDEFALMHSGILPSYALRSMSAIRRNSKKILDKFHNDMDGAFLLHRALVLDSEDAFDQLPELLAEEMLAVMLDDQESDEILSELVKDAVNALPLDGFLWNSNVAGSSKNGPDILRAYLSGGNVAISADYKFKKSSDVKQKVSQIHTVLNCGTSNGDKKLASLFNVRTRYSTSKEPSLGFGTIVRWKSGLHDDPFQYGFCMMPICDSIRLDGSAGQRTAFPFWTLKETGSGRGIVLLNGEGDFITLMAVVGKPKDLLWIDRFAPSDDGVVVGKKVDDAYFFEGTGLRLEWVAQLKPSHAQRVAQDIGQSFSRVGVVEAEWLRLTTN